MKRLLFLLIVCALFVPSASAQGLERSALLLEKDHPDEFVSTIRSHVISEIGFDLEEVVGEINRQSNSLVELADLFENEKPYKVANVLMKGSRPGFAMANYDRIKDRESLTLEDMIKLNCDWTEVKGEYERLVKADKW